MNKTLFAFGVSMLGLFLTCLQPAFCQDDYQFDLSEIEKEIEKRPYSIGGFIEVGSSISGLDRDAAFHRLRFFERDEGRTIEQYDLGLRLEGSFQKGIAGLYFRAHGLLWHDYLGWDGEIDLLEGYLSLKPSLAITIDAGKKVTKWGKGYAWNPVSFVDRPKNSEDPEGALEGFYVLTADFVKSFEGPLKTVAFTPVILPVTGHINDEFGEPDHINFAAKLYLLLWDTDLDFLFFTGPIRTTRYGLDFSRNIQSNFEIHGELAWIPGVVKKSIDSQGMSSTRELDVVSGLLGIRYLTANEMTFIFEYYHNGMGFYEDDLESFFQIVDRTYERFLLTGEGGPLLMAAQGPGQAFAQPNPMRDYLYIKASKNEPFDILYFTPAIAAIVNLHDRSFSLIPELTYSPKTNLELTLKGVLLVGEDNSEYGEKLNDYKMELRVKYFL